MGKLAPPYRIDRFSGLNERPNSYLDPTEASTLLNNAYGEQGKRKGYTRLNVTAIGADPIHSLYPYFKKDGSKILLAGAGTSLYKFNGTAFVAIKTGLSGDRFEFETYKDACYICNGVNSLMKYDGTTVSDLATAPKFKYIKLHRNRLFGLGNPADPSVLYFSEPTLPDNWPALNFTEVYTNDGDFGTGLAVFLDQLYAFKERSINPVDIQGDPTNWQVRKLVSNRGAVSQRSIAHVGGLLFFLSRSGVIAFDGIRAEPVKNENIQTTLSTLNQAKLNLACGIEFNNMYWLAVPDGSSLYNNKVILYDYINNNYNGTYAGINASCFATFNPNGIDKLYFGDGVNGLVHQYGEGFNDDGSAIEWTYITPFLDMGSPESLKKFKKLFIFAKAQSQVSSLKVYFDVNFSGDTGPITVNTEGQYSKWGAMEWGVDDWGGMDSVIIEVQKMSAYNSPKGRYIRFMFTNSEPNQPCSLNGFSLLYKQNRPK